MTDASVPGITLRRALPADAATVRDLTRRAYAKWVPLLGREPSPMGADYDTAVRTHVIDLLIDHDRIVGLIEMLPATDHLLIENVAVDPATQGQGYGRRLLAHAESVAADRGLNEIRLYTNALFAENIRLYRMLGYTVAREEAFKGGRVVHMSKTLAASR